MRHLQKALFMLLKIVWRLYQIFQSLKYVFLRQGSMQEVRFLFSSTAFYI